MQITDVEVLSILDDVTVAVSTEKMNSTKASAGAGHRQDKCSQTKQQVEDKKLTKTAKAPPQPPLKSKDKEAPVHKVTQKSSAEPCAIDRQALTKFYEKYCPEKVDRIDVMLQKFEPGKIVGALRKVRQVLVVLHCDKRETLLSNVLAHCYSQKYGEVPELQFLLVSEPVQTGDAVEAVPDSNVLGLGGGSNGGGAWWDETEEEEEQLERLRAATRREEQEQKRVQVLQNYLCATIGLRCDR